MDSFLSNRVLHKAYIGIDIHRTKQKVAIILYESIRESNSCWKEAIFLDIENNYNDFSKLHCVIREHVKEPKAVSIAVDHTGRHYSEPLVYFLQRLGYEIQYLEPKGVKAAKDRLLDEEGKSDVIDAAALAYMLYMRDIHGISFRISSVKSELGSKASLLRHLVLQKQTYNKLLTQTINRLHQFLLAVFPEGEAKHFRKLLRIISYYPTPKDILKSRNLDGIKYLNKADKESIIRLADQTVGIPGEFYRDIIRDLNNQRVEIVGKLDNINKIIKKEVLAHEYGSILLSFPYFGSAAAATIISVVGDINRWPNKKKLKKALGVYSTLRQSGTSVSRGRMGKEGSRHGRRALFLVVLLCIRNDVPDNDFKDYYLRQVARGKLRIKAVVSTMGKLAEIIYHCLHTRELYEYQGKYK